MYFVGLLFNKSKVKFITKKKGVFMLNQEEKEYWDFINKFNHSLAELNNDFSKLSQNNKIRVENELLEFVKIKSTLKTIEMLKHR